MPIGFQLLSCHNTVCRLPSSPRTLPCRNTNCAKSMYMDGDIQLRVTMDAEVRLCDVTVSISGKYTLFLFFHVSMRSLCACLCACCCCRRSVSAASLACCSARAAFIFACLSATRAARNCRRISGSLLSPASPPSLYRALHSHRWHNGSSL